MHTARLVPISPSMHCAGCLPMVGEGSASGPGGGGGLLMCVCVGGGGVPASGQGGAPGGYPSMHWGRPPAPPPVNRILDTRF